MDNLSMFLSADFLYFFFFQNDFSPLHKSSSLMYQKGFESDFSKTISKTIYAFLHLHILHYLSGMLRPSWFAGKALPDF